MPGCGRKIQLTPMRSLRTLCWPFVKTLALNPEDSKAKSCSSFYRAIRTRRTDHRGPECARIPSHAFRSLRTRDLVVAEVREPKPRDDALDVTRQTEHERTSGSQQGTHERCQPSGRQLSTRLRKSLAA